MAPLTYVDLEHPKGWVVRTQHFPSEDVATFQATLGAFLDEAYANEAVIALPDDATMNKAAKLWSYYRVADAIVKRMTSIEWQTSKQGEGSKGQDAAQLAEWIKARDGYLAQFDNAVADPEEIPPSAIQPTMALPTDAVWGM